MQRSNWLALSTSILLLASVAPVLAGQQGRGGQQSPLIQDTSSHVSIVARSIARNSFAPRNAPAGRTAVLRGKTLPPYPAIYAAPYPAMLASGPSDPRILIGPDSLVGASAIPRIEPLSVTPVDPRVIVSRLPSGRIVMTNPYYRAESARGRKRQVQGPRTAYAPPAFHIIGEMSGKHMSNPVKLTHGIKPGRRFRHEPQVVFFVQKPGEKFLTAR
jgi:hypothetical protein